MCTAGAKSATRVQVSPHPDGQNEQSLNSRESAVLDLELGLASLIVMVNSIVWDNHTPEISCCPYLAPNLMAIGGSILAGGLEGIETNGHGTYESLGRVLDQDPLFRDAGAGDYTLVLGSPCIDAGFNSLMWNDEVIVDLEPEDYCGEAVDMGALEYCPDPGSAYEPRVLAEFRLNVYPNPSMTGATVSFSLFERGPVRIAIFDLNGRLVLRSPDRSSGPGTHSLSWNGRDATGRLLPSGIYEVRMETARRTESRVLRLLR
ncbi:FlgD immunoglobulin-like domain containing protein [Candidatus Eisenbacteria bacterium]|uniref:FlgD immunoglobulin-like domain containing protein n=1 Tax=Eiseniibacteriota bacterium TaxID=2212470 RepID=A0ABV6YIQ6_UNCEI